jgi:hypothetical protein
MKSKTESAYLNAFKFISTQISKSPQIYVGDFELHRLMQLKMFIKMLKSGVVIFILHKLFGDGFNQMIWSLSTKKTNYLENLLRRSWL